MLLIVMFSTFSRTTLQLTYYTNRADYAKNCVNKKKPMLHCNGKCQLAKKIAEQEKKEKEESHKGLLAQEEVVTIPQQYIVYSFPIIKRTSNKFPIYTSQLPVIYTGSIFQPPRLNMI